ncbi:MAG: putative FeS assembly SUF system protein SufT [Myxococcota bacterium]
MTQEPVTFADEVEVIQIPDGTPIMVPIGTGGWVMQVLGGNFTVRLETGHLVRVNGPDAAAIGQDIPKSPLHGLAPGDFSEELVWDQLRTIYDPEIPVNIVELGLIYTCEVAEDDASEGGKAVTITMTLTAPGCGMGQVLKDDVEYKVKTLPGVTRTDVELTFDPPWSPELMSEEAQLELGFF